MEWSGFWTGVGVGFVLGVLALAGFALWWDRRAWRKAGGRRAPARSR